MTVVRLPDWENRLQAYLDAHRETGEPCGYFVAGAVEAQTGWDPRAYFRGRYAWVRSHLAEAVDEILPQRLPIMARTGDVVQVKGGGLGVCVGGDAMAVAEGGGLALIDRAEWEKAWTVG
jgi:hypothetical protein